jgi:serine phosphatase RsbU (regulator of sigma subunit)
MAIENDEVENVTAAGLDVLESPPVRSISEEPTRTASHIEIASDEAHSLIQRLFGGIQQQIPEMLYAIAYRAANGQSGGDIADVFHYAGKGSAAAAQAAMVKYGLRTLASFGLMPESVMRSLNRLYFREHHIRESARVVRDGLLRHHRRNASISLVLQRRTRPGTRRFS